MKYIVLAALAVSCTSHDFLDGGVPKDGNTLQMNERSYEVGDPCEVNGQCPGGICIKEKNGYTFPDGYCSSPCDPGANDCNYPYGVCGVDSTGLAGQCYHGCIYPSDCREEYTCFFTYPSTGLCWPK